MLNTVDAIQLIDVMLLQVNRTKRDMIIIEGIDNSGKSTLAKYLAGRLHWRVQESEGPPKSIAEFNDRIRRYGRMKRTVMVRHPIFSQDIYGILRGDVDIIEPQVRAEFAERKPLVIYCDPLDRGMATHVVKRHDTPEHLDALTTQYVTLLGAYRSWAYRRANLIYRIGDSAPSISRMVIASLPKGMR